jgi:hypothetical protein
MKDSKYYLVCQNSQEIAISTDMCGFQAWSNASYAGNPRLIDSMPCAKCGKYQAGSRWGVPYIIDIEYLTRDAGDICFGPGEIFISERFRDCWNRFGLVGLIGFDQVDVRKVKRHIKNQPGVVPQYFHVDVAQSNVVFDRDGSGVVSMSNDVVCPVCNMGGPIAAFRRINLKLEGNQASAPDMFVAKGLPGRIIISSRFLKAASEAALKNVVVVPIEKAMVDHFRLWRT